MLLCGSAWVTFWGTDLDALVATLNMAPGTPFIDIERHFFLGIDNNRKNTFLLLAATYLPTYLCSVCSALTTGLCLP